MEGASCKINHKLKQLNFQTRIELKHTSAGKFQPNELFTTKLKLFTRENNFSPNQSKSKIMRQTSKDIIQLLDANITPIKGLKLKNTKYAHNFRLDSTYLHVNQYDRPIEILDQMAKPTTYRLLQGTQFKFNDKGSWQTGGAFPSLKNSNLNEHINFQRRTSA